MFSQSPVVCGLERAELADVWSQSAVFVLMVNGLLTVSEYFTWIKKFYYLFLLWQYHLTTCFARVGPLLPMDMLLMFVEYNV